MSILPSSLSSLTLLHMSKLLSQESCNAYSRKRESDLLLPSMRWMHTKLPMVITETMYLKSPIISATEQLIWFLLVTCLQSGFHLCWAGLQDHTVAPAEPGAWTGDRERAWGSSPATIPLNNVSNWSPGQSFVSKMDFWFAGSGQIGRPFMRNQSGV